MSKWLTLFIVVGLLLLSVSTVAASPPAKPAPEIERGVFVHYQGNMAYWYPPNAPEPTDECTRYKYTHIRWADPEVTYSVDVTNAPLSDTDKLEAVNAIKAAFGAWETEPATVWGITDMGIDFVFDAGSANTVSWGDTSDYPGAIAVTFYSYWPWGELIEVDTVMNSALDWSTTGGSGKFDVQNIVTHEVGHWLILDDLYNWKTQKLTMYGYSDFGETDKQSLGYGDALGIDRIY